MTTEAATTSVAPSIWADRFRFAVATAIVWAGLHFVAGALMPGGPDRPLVLGDAGLIGGVVVVLLLWLSGAVAGLVAGVGDRRRPLAVLGLGLAVWVWEGGRTGGTMDDWLARVNVVPGDPSGVPYWWLLADYVYLLVGVAGAYAIVALLPAPVRAGSDARTKLRGAFGLDAKPDQVREGLTALATTLVSASIVIYLLMGPAVSWTRRGQVFFAVILGCVAGVFLASRTSKAIDPLWYWPVPFVIGLVGIIGAGIWPAFALGGPYDALDVIPAWPLARALPVEMVSAGLLGIVWMLHPPEPEASVPAR